MAKTLAIIGYSQETVDMYASQINSLFSGMLGVKKYSIKKKLPAETIRADIVLAESGDAYERVREWLPTDCEIVFAQRTISKNGYTLIQNIPAGTEAVLLDESMEMAQEMIAALYQIGVRHLLLSPATEEISKTTFGKVMIRLRDSGGTAGGDQVVNIGPSLLETGTIIDIGIRADLDYILNRQNIKQSYKEIMTVNIGLAEILAKTNRFESSMDILLGVFDQGVIAINADGRVFSCNQKAKTILGHENDTVIGENGVLLFPDIPFAAVLHEETSVSEKLLQIGGYDVIVTVNPIVHSGKELGAVAIIKRFSEEERKHHSIRSQLIGKGHKARYHFPDILGESEAIEKCRAAARKMARSDSSVLISGESGTGKEMFAQSIHNESKRREFQFVAVNCGALPESLLESELFGYEEGAFTGAKRGGKPGLFELAHKGTLFLDEIGEMPLKLQRSLLRVLEEREVMRLGGDRLIAVDIRLIAASNKNLREMAAQGSFREDLFYRLNVLPLFVPPLRARKEDIPAMIEGFQKNFDWKFELSAAAENALLAYGWPGNIRELRNCIEYISNLELKTVESRDLPITPENAGMEPAGWSAAVKTGFPEMDLSETLKEHVEDLRRIAGKDLEKYRFILEALAQICAEGKRAGRRSLTLAAREEGLLLGEQQVRGICIDLAKLGLAEINEGRGGTVITKNGRQAAAWLLKE